MSSTFQPRPPAALSMFEPTEGHPITSSCPTGSSDSFICTSDDMVNEQVTNYSATDLNVVELTEIEYTQLQQLLCSHSSEAAQETRMSAPYFFPCDHFSSVPQDQSNHHTTSSCEGQNVPPGVCQSVVCTDGNIVRANQVIGHGDFPELRMMLLSEFSLPSTNGKKPLGNIRVGSSGAGLTQVKPVSNVIGLNKENENLDHTTEPRTKSTVRVRLEDRFNSLQTDVPRCTEMVETAVTANNLVSLIHPPLQILGSQQPSKCTPLTSSSLNCGATCPLLEAAKNQEISLSQSFSSCYQQGPKSAKQNLLPSDKLLSEDIFIKVEGTSYKRSIKKRSRSHLRQANTEMERRVLGDIRNTCQGTPWAATADHTAEQVSDARQTCMSQRRERHNRMERDRRRRIRVCCDELNSLVPFCTVETDKATTLQWTTAFLKYIQERHGDTLKKEFETVFCGRTGRRLKIVRSEGPRTGSVQEAAGSSSLQNIK
ncbi:transcription factor-like 5 protein isoform X2 [Engystomops pustulosus]|uniref:transcription factor-like 5 protein isoform X2 n=1 Tax=Engystomops pustulosus TaxID=76066 RepID=UPI003AFAF1C3